MFRAILPHSDNSTYNFNESSDTGGRCEGRMAAILAWSSLSILFSLVGCPACVAVLWELFRRHKIGASITPNDVFMVNLTLMDCVFLFFVPLIVSNSFLWRNAPFQTFATLLYSLNLDGRPLFTACICLDCYVAVVHPVFYRARKSLTPRVLMAVAAWAVTFAQGMMYIFITKIQHNFLAVLLYFVTLPVIVFCNFSILWTLKKSPAGRRGLHPQKKKALQIITSSLVMMVIAYFPPAVGFTFGKLMMSKQEYECIFVLIILIPPTAGSALMPVLHLGFLRKLKGFCYLK